MKTVKTIDSLIKELQKIRKKVGNKRVLLATDSVDNRIDPFYGLEPVNVSFEEIIWNEKDSKSVIIRCSNPDIQNQFD